MLPSSSKSPIKEQRTLPLLSPPRNNQKIQAEQSKNSSKMPSVLLSSNPCKKPSATPSNYLKEAKQNAAQESLCKAEQESSNMPSDLT
jgi:hypothetical protein